MSECNHDKVFSNYVLTSNPPQYPWICRKCGYMSRDIGEYYSARNEYEELIEKFRKDLPTNQVEEEKMKAIEEYAKETIPKINAKWRKRLDDMKERLGELTQRGS